MQVKEVAPYGESKTMAKEVYLNGDMRAGYDKEVSDHQSFFNVLSAHMSWTLRPRL